MAQNLGVFGDIYRVLGLIYGKVKRRMCFFFLLYLAPYFLVTIPSNLCNGDMDCCLHVQQTNFANKDL